jgi:hypothetical protein
MRKIQRTGEKVLNDEISIAKLFVSCVSLMNLALLLLQDL